MTPPLNVDDPLREIAQLQQEKAQLLTVLTTLHRDIFAYDMAPSVPRQAALYLQLMGSMSQARTLIRRLGGEA